MKRILYGLGLLAPASLVSLAVVFLYDPGADRRRDPVPPPEGRDCTLRHPLVLSHHWGVEPRTSAEGEIVPTEHPQLPPRNDPVDNPALRGREAEGYYRYFSHAVVERLERLGVELYIADKAPFASNEARARDLRATVLRALEETGASKVNLVGHSQGSQDGRYLISNLHRFDRDDPRSGTDADFPMGSRVASWTGLAGEATGAGVADLALLAFPVTWALYDEVVLGVDPHYPELRSPERRAARRAELRSSLRRSLEDLSTDYMSGEGEYAGAGAGGSRGFHAPDVPGVHYQSYAARIRQPPLAWLPDWGYWLYLRISEGENDGYASVASQSYGERRAVLEGPPGSSGVHHMYFTGRPGKQYAPEGTMSAPDFFERLVCDLAERGF